MANLPIPGGLEEQCSSIGWVRPSRRIRLISSTPRVGQYFWIDFPHDAYAPEFCGEHPGIVVRAAQNMSDTCIIVPVTSTTPRDYKHVHTLSRNPNPLTPKTAAWVVCNHLYTVNISRVRPCKAKYGNNVFPSVDDTDLKAIFSMIRASMPHLG